MAQTQVASATSSWILDRLTITFGPENNLLGEERGGLEGEEEKEGSGGGPLGLRAAL